MSAPSGILFTDVVYGSNLEGGPVGLLPGIMLVATGIKVVWPPSKKDSKRINSITYQGVTDDRHALISLPGKGAPAWTASERSAAKL